MRRSTAATVLLSLLLMPVLIAGCAASPGATGDTASGSATPAPVTISISGAFALYPMMQVWAEEYSTLNPHVQFDIQAGGAGKGMSDVLSGAVDVAMVSRGIRDEELAQGAYAVPVTIDAVVGVVNANNPALEDLLRVGLTPERLAAVWLTQDITTWGQFAGTDETAGINLYTRSDASGAAEMWALYGGGTAQEELQGTGVNADPGLLEAVRLDPLGIGYNNIGFAYDLASGEQIEGIRVLPIDLNGDGVISPDEDFYLDRDDLIAAVGDRRYPFPPARELYLVTKDKPSPEVAALYRYILSEGQGYTTLVGYVPLAPERIDAALTLLEE